MRQVIRRFVKHLEIERNASHAHVKSYLYDLNKFRAYLVQELWSRIN